MAEEKKSFYRRLKEGYEAAKKPLAFFLAFAIAIHSSSAVSLLPQKFVAVSYPLLLILLISIVFQMLFEIYEKTMQTEKELIVINSNKVYSQIQEIVSNETKVDIKFIGTAGRFGWTTVLEKLLDENSQESMIKNGTRFNIEIALFNPGEEELKKEEFNTFEGVSTVAREIRELANYLPKVATAGSKLSLRFYSHMPNMLGFLVNGNYLFVTYAYWDTKNDNLALQAGGSDYFVYDKNDAFGGQEVIRRFLGWCAYIEASSENELAPVEQIQSNV